MKMIRTWLDMFVIFLLFGFVVGEVTYEGQLMDMTGCLDYDNDALCSDNLKLEVAEDGESMQIAGFIDINKEIDDNYNVQLLVTKQTEAGNEPMFGCEANVCASLKDEKAAWYSLVQAMNITGCPIQVGQYKMDKLKMNMNFAKEVLTHEYCGDYIVEFKITSSMGETFSCHVLGVCIVELPDDEE